MGQVRRLLGDEPAGAEGAAELLARAAAPLRPEGRPLYAGALAQAMPDTALGQVWRLGDMLREYRGDAHTAAWISAGLDATEIGLLTELFWGLPLRSYTRTRAWSDAEFDAAEERLTARGLIAEGAFTAAGRELREGVEVATDAQLAPALTALGDDLDELLGILQPWGDTVRAGHGYLAAGPHDLARRATPADY